MPASTSTPPINYNYQEPKPVNLRSECSKRYRKKKTAAGWLQVNVLLSPRAAMLVRTYAQHHNCSVAKAIDTIICLPAN